MAKRFTKRHEASGYAAMGNSMKRPRSHSAARRQAVKEGSKLGKK